MHKRIIYNRHDGGVTVCTPTDWIISVLGCGGFWGDKPHGFMDIQIERQIARGVNPDAAFRYAKAMMVGGCTTAEALEIIRDRDCAHLGTAIELWDVDEIPRDRWFRDAWSRSHNGGPISVNLKLAKPIQMKRIGEAVIRENHRREHELRPPFEYDRDRLRTKIMSARDELELRHIWPKELQCKRISTAPLNSLSGQRAPTMMTRTTGGTGRPG